MGQYQKITIPCNSEIQEILIAELGLLKYDSFQEIDNELEAYILEADFDEQQLISVLEKYGIASKFKVDKLEDVNWNAEWEKNFDPVYVDEQVQIRAAFHECRPKFKFDIVINPKMSFGTGHHETTHLMVSEQLRIDHHQKKVMDLGTGTGVLAIMAYKLGASSITATDIDDWCIENSKENFQLNQLKNFQILQGSIDKLTLEDDYQIIYANINKNVLLEELPLYAKILSPGGIIMLSGFYTEDITDLKEVAAENNLVLEATKSRNNWALMRLSTSKI